MENRNIRWIVIRDFHRGFASTPSIPGELTYMQNLRYNRDGTVSARCGALAITSDLGDRAQGIFSTWAGGVGKKWIYVYDGNIHHSADPPTTPAGAPLYSGGNTTSYPVFEEFGGYAIIINVDTKPVRYDGAACAVIAAAPSSILGTFHSDYLFVAGDNSARLYWSASGDINTWPAANYIDVGDTLEPIKALAVLRDSLIIFKSASIWELSGKNNENFYLRRIATNIGCDFQSACLAIGEDFILFVHNGQLWNLSNGFHYMSEQLSGEFLYHSSGRVALGLDRENQMLYASVPTGAATANLKTLDLVHKIWTKDTGDYCNFYHDGFDMYAGKRTDGKFFRLNSGTQDDGVNFETNFQTRFTDCGADGYEKYMRCLICDATSSANISVDIYYRLSVGGAVSTLSYNSVPAPFVLNLPKERFHEISFRISTTAAQSLKIRELKLGFIPIRRVR